MTSEEARRVFSLAFTFWPPSSVFRYFARNPDGRIFGCAVHHPRELAVFTEWADRAGFNSYWGINPTRKQHGTRCSASDITHLCFLPLDIDPIQPEYNPFPALYAAEEWLSVELPGFIPENRILLHSGRGIQSLYAVQPIPSGALYIRLSYLLDRLATWLGTLEGCQLDPSCADLSRVMRLPFTVNQKTGVRTDLLQSSFEVAIPDPLSLLSILPRPAARPASIPLPLQDHWIDYLPHLTVTARRFLQEGVSAPGRHKAATAAMLSLIELGAEEAQVRSALTVGAVLCEPPLNTRDVEQMVERRFRLTSSPRFGTLYSPSEPKEKPCSSK